MINTNHIRIMILDNHGTAKKNIPLFLENVDDFQLVGVASDTKEALRLCNQFRPDMLLMNLPVPNTNEAIFMEHIGTTHPDIQIVAVTDFEDEALLRTALQVGVVGCMLNDIQSTRVFVGSEVVL